MADQSSVHASNGFHGTKEKAENAENAGEAVCFTAGLEGAPFGAGVIHAYLAANREPPKVVAGISMGALTSAAFQRAYRELKTPGEDARWQWYRRYLRAISEKPLEVIWSGIPDQSDFFAEFNPVEDPAPRNIADIGLKKELTEAELGARRDLTLFVKLGHWISRLPVKVGSVAGVVVKFVRMKEGYGYSFALWRYITFFLSLLPVIMRPLIYNAFHPQFIKEAAFEPKWKRPGTALLFAVVSFVPMWILLGLLLTPGLENKLAVLLWGLFAAALLGTLSYAYLSSNRPRPLFGWPLYGASVTFCVVILMALVWLVVALGHLAADWFPLDQTNLSSGKAGWYSTIGAILQKFNGVLFPGAKLGMKVLFLVVFVSTSAAAMQMIQNGTRKKVRRAREGFIKALASFWALRAVRWIAYSLGFLVLSCAGGAATVRPFRSFVARIAEIPWVHQAITGVIEFNTFMASAARFAIDQRYWIISICAFLLAIFVVRRGQRLSQSERESVASAKSRRRPRFFALSMPSRMKFSTWLAWLFFVSVQEFLLAICWTAWMRTLALGFLGVSLALWIQVAWQSYGLRWRLSLQKWVDFLANVLFGNLNLHKSLVHNYYLRLALYDLFRETNEHGKEDQEPVLRSEPFPIVLVAAPLQVTAKKHELDSYQIWAAEKSSLINALAGALAVPGLYEPSHVAEDDEIDWSQSGEAKAGKTKGLEAWWLPPESRKDFKELDVVDGTVVRENPIPPFFQFIAQAPKANGELSLVEQLSSTKDDPRVHIVYSVPIDPAPREKRDVNASIVDVGLAAAKLSRRRDTQLEVHQTNLLSQVEAQLRKLGVVSDRMNPIFADEIAPQSDAGYKSPLSPTREEVLDRVAAGCRATLEVIYAKKLNEIAEQSGELVSCSVLMSKVSRRKQAQESVPGLPEVCAACQKCCKSQLRSPRRKTDGKADLKPVNTWASLLDNGTDFSKLRHLSGEEPRIVFVASGGVFRGTFHAGMVAALLAARIKPDLIVGASVGTIMGGALAAAFSTENYAAAINHLAKLVSVLLSVDHQVAFTKPFKNAVRDLGIRARDITISPNDIRKMVLDGSRKDAAFGVVGAPSALIDSISHLLLIPHKSTAEIAAEFIAGHVTQATKKLLDQLKEETLKRLKIEYAVMGTSLIEPAARGLLRANGSDVARLQPFTEHGMAVYGTTIDFWRQRPVLLGAGKEGRAYDFIEAALCSSAFPCVFAPRRESDLYPGTGDPTTLFSDGGMFDNLPFLPAVEILSKIQATQIDDDKKKPGKPALEVSMDALRRRYQQPDLFIAGSLDVNLQEQEDLENVFQNIVQIMERASALQNNVKIKGFLQVLTTLDDQLRRLLEQQENHPKRTELDFELLDEIVNAAILPVYPIDPEHLNGTFAFCASTGMKPDRLKDSMADGCFQTLRAFVNPASAGSAAPGNGHLPLLARSIAGLKDCGKLPQVGWNAGHEAARFEIKIHRNGNGASPQRTIESPIPAALVETWTPGHCKYFKLPRAGEGNTWFKPEQLNPVQSFPCPFYQAAQQILDNMEENDKVREKQARQLREIYDRCITDEAHIRVHPDALPPSGEKEIPTTAIVEVTEPEVEVPHHH